MGNTADLLLICEYPVLGIGIVGILQSNTEFSIRQESNFSSIYSVLRQQKLDVVLIELVFLKSSGLLSLKELLKAYPLLKIIVLGRGEREPFISKSFEYGALGYLSLKCEPKEIAQAVDKVLRGEKYLSHQVALDYAMSNLEKNQHIASILTVREYQVFVELAKGRSASEIGALLHLSPKTIHVYRANILEKLHVKNSSELTLIALKHGIISIDVID